MAKLTWQEARALEDIEIQRRGSDAEPARRVGLAISGGGIRSATFALGVLEGLKHRQKLASLSYLSTVSGGGYIGSWLSAGCLRNRNWLTSADWTGSIAHLRRYSNYLSPKVGFLSADTWSMVTIWLRNTLLIQLTVILGIACLLMLPRPLYALFLWWPNAGDLRWVTIGLFLLGAVGIASNQLRMTGHDQLWFLRGEKWLPCTVVALISFGVTRWYGHHVDFEPFRGGPIQVGQAVPIALGMVVGVFALQPIAVILFAFLYRLIGWSPPTQVNYTQGWVQWFVVVPLMTAGFLVAAILWAESTGAAALGSTDPELLTLKALDSYGAFFLTARLYWPFPLAVVFVSLLMLALSSAAWGLSLKGLKGVGVGVLGALVGIVVLHALLSAVMLIMHAWARDHQPWRAFVWGPPLVAGSFVLTICVLVGILSRQSTEGVREWLSRLGAWLGIYATGWMVVTVTAVYSKEFVDWVVRTGPPAIVAGGGWIATTVGGLWAGNSPSTSGEPNQKSLGTKVKEGIVSVAPLLFIVGMLVGVAYVLDLTVALNSTQQTWFSQAGETADLSSFRLASLTVLGIVFAILLVVAWRVDINEFSLNAFYRHRLARCYLGATRLPPDKRTPQNFTGFDDSDDVPLAALAGGATTGPYPIVNCALNLGGSSDLALHTRHSASFTLTPLTCGSAYVSRGEDEPPLTDGAPLPVVGFFPTADYGGKDDAPTLGQAISVSGAAASPNMGYHTSPLVAFLLTVFNLRLGWWFPHPSKSSTKRSSPLFNLFGLMSELFGGASDTSRFLMVSDGGHFENLAAYELVRRRCGTIIISDGECDPKLTFEGLGTLIRMCEVDFGVTIDLKVDDIRLASAGWSGKRHAKGAIKWGAWAPPGTPDGTIVYMKASMTGREDTPILQYKSSHRDFPHESTGDQFYREDQFESYRQLGREVALEAF